MATTKLGLPTISGNMTADVVRDMNALAQAVDSKAGAASGLAMYDGNGKVINADGSLAGEVTQAEFDAHLVDKALHVRQTTSEITLYVSPSGLDTNNGVTSGKALKSILAALAKIPQIINHTVTINVDAGTYLESVDLSGFVGNGTIYINGGTDSADAYVINKVWVNRCQIPVYVTGFKSMTTDSISFFANTSQRVHFDHCVALESAGVNAGVQGSASNVSITNCIISNKAIAISGILQAQIYSKDNAGTGNIQGLSAIETSTIGKSGTQPSGTTQEVVDLGGQIR